MPRIQRATTLGTSCLLAATLLCGSAWAEPAWIHGSWVNLRSAPNPTASVKAQLTTNTLIELAAREGEWCAVRVASPMAEGYVHCSLVGTAPLTLAEAANQPGRAFWIAPSFGRLAAYGGQLRSGPAYQRMYAVLQDGQTARIQPLPEFDAAKRLMAAGVVPQVEAEVNRGDAVAPEKMEYYRLLQPAPIRRSFFKSHGDIVLRSEGDGDSLAAVMRVRLSVKAISPPMGYISRHEGPEISGISGFGDLGQVELHFAPPMLVYSLLPNGLLSAAHLSKQSLDGIPEYGEYCGKKYSGRNVGLPTSDILQTLDMRPAAGFPRLPESTLLMASFVTAKPLAMKKLTIRSRAARVPDIQRPASADASEFSLMAAIPKVVLHEVDFDGDKIADMLVWDTPSIGSMSGGFNLRRTWYLNIDGRWYAAGGMDDQECT